MNKTIEGKFNIIDTKNTIDIEGVVENYNKGDKVTINSEYKESVIYTLIVTTLVVGLIISMTTKKGIIYSGVKKVTIYTRNGRVEEVRPYNV